MRTARFSVRTLAALFLVVFGLACALPALVRNSDNPWFSLTEEETKEPAKDEVEHYWKAERPAQAVVVQQGRLLLALVNQCNGSLPTEHIAEVPVPPPEV